MFLKRTVFKNFVDFTGKHLCLSCFFNKVACGTVCFPIKFANFLRTPPMATSENNEQQELFKGFNC